MQTPPELFDPLRFLLIELHKQLQHLVSYLETEDDELAEKSLSRVDYIDNFHTSLQNRSAQYLIEHSDEEGQQETLALTQSYQQLANRLKSFSRQLETVTQQALAFKKLKLIQKPNLFKVFDTLGNGLELIESAFNTDTSERAIDLCRLQTHTAKLCDQQLQNYQARIKRGQQINSLMNAVFIIREIRRLGDELMQVGEAILSAHLGQTIQLDRYEKLQETLSALNLDPNAPDFSMVNMAETKSGCTISGVSAGEEPHETDPLAIFKEGQKQKLMQEKKGIESWHKKFPGIAPKVYSYHKQGQKAALLYEYLTGDTFDTLLLDLDRKNLQAGLDKLFTLLQEIWQETQIKERHSATFMRQLKKRLKDIYRVHPDFDLQGFQVGEMRQASLETLVERAAELEAELTPPPSVYIHGDFNVDNILYDPLEDQISFIDLHRSEYSDYIQDLSVFMVSNYRLNSFDPDVRKLIALTMQAVYEFGERYAKQIGDDSYHLRMALGLARSFLTSTRFILDTEHAKEMHYRGRYLLEQLIKLKPKRYSTYRISKELFRE